MPRICTVEFLRDHFVVVSDMVVFAGCGGHLAALICIVEAADDWNAAATWPDRPLAEWKHNAQLCGILATHGQVDCLRFVLGRGYVWPDRAEFASRSGVYCIHSPQAECVRIAASNYL